MISTLRGTVLAASSDRVIVEVGGVGFAVAVTTTTAAQLRVGEETFLFTHLVVREDAMLLFGFSSADELDVFTLLIGVTGVGPKSALGVLGHLSISQIAEAIAAEDEAPFRRVSGIGPKTAKLIAVQLQGKIASPAVPAASPVVAPEVAEQVRTALVGLGWPERVAQDALDAVVASADDATRRSAGVLLRLSLAQLGPAQPGGARG